MVELWCVIINIVVVEKWCFNICCMIFLVLIFNFIVGLLKIIIFGFNNNKWFNLICFICLFDNIFLFLLIEV